MIPIGTNLRQNRLPVVTLVIIGVNIVFFLFELAVPQPVLGLGVFLFGYGPANWWNPIALLTSMFLHASIYHIAFNMLFFWIFGAPVEERVGRLNFLIYYLICGAGSGILFTVMTALASPGALSPAIGASGAISGIMGLFLYRCYYSKLKMVISPILLPRQVNIPVVPLVILWFLQNVIFGILTLGATGGVAHWGHVGGFIAGIIIGRVKRYGQEGRVENLREKILARLASGGGWASAEKELMKLLDVAPDDAELNLDLARLYADRGQNAAAARFYQKAVRLLYNKKPLDGAYALLEYNETTGKALPPAQQVRAAEALAKDGDYEGALKLYAPAASEGSAKDPVHEKALAYYAAVARHLGMAEESFEAAGRLMSAYPESVYRQKVRAALMTEPGKVFRPPVRPPEADVQAQTATEVKEAAALGWIEVAQRFFMDPEFWSILLFLNIATPFLMPRIYFSKAAPVIIFILAYVMTVLHRIGLEGWLFNFRKSQKQADMEFEVKKLFNHAKLAETGGRFEEAANLYEELLAKDRGDIQARFNLARIYQSRLENMPLARKHFRALMSILPEGHVFRIEAETALQRQTA
jgi:membrane associated rhomboid family serine protease